MTKSINILTVDPATLPFVRAWVESIRSRAEQHVRHHSVESISAYCTAVAHLANGRSAEARACFDAAKLHSDACSAHARVWKQCDVALRGYHYDAARAGR